MGKSKLYRILRPILTFLIKIIFRPVIIGKENIPQKGRMVLAGNHTNILDPVLLLASTKRTVHFLAKIELVNGPFGFIFKHMGIIPVNRQIKDKTVMPTAIKGLEQNKIIGVFPEGTTEKGRGLLPFKTGAVRMAQSANSQILPFAIIGKYRIFKGPILIFGKPYTQKTNDVTKENDILRNIVVDLIKKGENYGKNK